uniref:Uncharacterized protein n=1 Tax=Cannabis sativa TaxID=3483 RepID=A0A803R7M0_CANSA
MHGIDVIRVTVLKCMRIFFVGPNGGYGGMATLCHNATERPRVNQISTEHHILNQYVEALGFIDVFWGSEGSGVRSRSRSRERLTHRARVESTQ